MMLIALALAGQACRVPALSQTVGSSMPPPTSKAVVAPPTLADLWNGRATWVRDARNVGADFNFHFLSILPDGSTLWAYFITVAPKMGIGRAQSTDGLRWF